MHSAATAIRGVAARRIGSAPPRSRASTGHVDEHGQHQHALEVGHRRGVAQPVGVGQRVAGDAGAAGERVAAVARARGAVEAAHEQHPGGDHGDAGALRRAHIGAERHDADRSTSTGATPRESG